MLNPANANEELGARVFDILLKLRLDNALSDDELHALCYAVGVQIPVAPKETPEQKQRRHFREAAECELRG